MLLLKFLRNDGYSPHQGYPWPLPAQNEDGTWTPGEWTPVVEDISMCEQGYHAATVDGITRWHQDACYVAEVKGQYIHEPGRRKLVAQSMRLLYPVEAWTKALPSAEHLRRMRAAVAVLVRRLKTGQKLARDLLRMLEANPDGGLSRSQQGDFRKRLYRYRSLKYYHEGLLDACINQAHANGRIRYALDYVGREYADTDPILATEMACALLDIEQIPPLPDQGVIAA